MTPSIAACAWPLSRLDEAVELLARHVGQPPAAAARGRGAALWSGAAADRAAVGHAIAHLIFAHGLEVEVATLRHRDAADLPAPAVVRLPDPAAPGHEPLFLVVAGRQGRNAMLLGLDRRWKPVDLEACGDVVRGATDTAHTAGIDALLDAAAIRPGRRASVTRALQREMAGEREAADVWRIVVDPGAGFGWQLRGAGVARQAALLLVLHAAAMALWIASWVVIGRGALDGRTEWGWLTAWALVIATLVPLQLWASRLQGGVALAVGRLLKRRLLAGALRLEPDETRDQGAGQLLARVLESDAVEALAVGGGLQAALAVIEVAMAGGVLWVGASGAVHVPLLAACLLAGAAVGWRHHRHRERWAAARLAMTHALVERLAGHRTRLAQELPERWHLEEDRALEDYLQRSQALDAAVPALTVALPRGWTVLALVALAPALLAGAAPTALAISLGGVLLAAMALRRIGDGVSQLSGAAVAWSEARPLFDAAARRPAPSALDDRPVPGPQRSSRLEVRDVTFQYSGRPTAVLHACSLSAAAGDRLLVQGSSGGGKSTLGSLVAGLRQPASGLILVDGLDRRTLGVDGWRRLVAAAPQFHENHVLSETFAFNLLMGRQWPPADADLDEAEQVARDLGLGPLIDRMPAGLLQQVGEGGWQLSHGERGRLFMARTLLQGGGLMILDESFAALDPVNLRDALECVLRRAPTLLVIAHP